MPYNVTPQTPPAMTSGGQWMTIAQIISGLVGQNGATTPPPNAAQTAALNAGQGPLTAAGAGAWQSMPSASPAQTPGYNTSQFDVPLGASQSNSY